MEFAFTPEQQEFRASVRRFAEDVIAPRAEEMDETEEFPTDIVDQMGKMGLFGIPFPEEYGGMGGDFTTLCIAIEELARVDSSMAITLEAGVGLGAMPIYLFGTEEQKQQWLVPLARGEKIAGFGLTEPNAGSDSGGTQTKAVLDGGEWLINGSKSFITNVGTPNSLFCTITAVTGEANGRKEISNIVVPLGTPGFTVGRKYKKMGWHASDTRELSFSDVRVPEANLLGTRGEGFKNFLIILDGGRVAIGALAVGLAQGCLEMSINYAKERKQFGRPIADFQAVQFKIADMAVDTDLARLAVYRAAWMHDQGMPFKKEASIAKLFSSEIAVTAARNAVQVHGGYGFMNEYPVSRFYRDSKVLEIGEGTSEVQRLLIARELGLTDA
ncbi:MAG TPA: acyl-CoA dehydrogenase family protein [Actinomycetota bacterium]|nr:acyl-CoA dehydrogenase family protein [Actinomycetota bacterium]